MHRLRQFYFADPRRSSGIQFLKIILAFVVRIATPGLTHLNLCPLPIRFGCTAPLAKAGGALTALWRTEVWCGVGPVP